MNVNWMIADIRIECVYLDTLFRTSKDHFSISQRFLSTELTVESNDKRLENTFYPKPKTFDQLVDNNSMQREFQEDSVIEFAIRLRLLSFIQSQTRFHPDILQMIKTRMSIGIDQLYSASWLFSKKRQTITLTKSA